MSDLAGVKVGDNLFIKHGYHSQGSIVTAERVTPSGRVITKVGEFNPNGRKRGDQGWQSTWARVATEDDIAGIYRHGLVRKLTDFRLWDKLSPDDLKAAAEIIAKYQTPRGA